MYRLILVDDLFKLVEEEIGEEYGKYITLLIDQDEKDSQKNQEKFNKISSKWWFNKVIKEWSDIPD